MDVCYFVLYCMLSYHFDCYCTNLIYIFVIFSVIGLPTQDEWPQGVSLPWASFYKYTAVPLENIIPEMCPEGIELMKVS